MDGPDKSLPNIQALKVCRVLIRTRLISIVYYVDFYSKETFHNLFDNRELLATLDKVGPKIGDWCNWAKLVS